MEGPRIPIVHLAGRLLVSIQLEMTDRLLERLKEDVANEIDRRGAGGLVIDVAGIETMDSFISRSICDLALIARLMGVPTVLCGIRPAVAITLSEMGIDLRGVPSALDVDQAVALCAAEEDEVDGDPFHETGAPSRPRTGSATSGEGGEW